MYVRQGSAGPEFRLWRDKMPEVWEKHRWVPHQTIETMAAMYRQSGSGKADPLLLYDLEVAKALLR